MQKGESKMSEYELERMFDRLIDARQYDLVDKYLEEIPTFDKAEEIRTRMYISKAEDLTKRIVEKQK